MLCVWKILLSSINMVTWKDLRIKMWSSCCSVIKIDTWSWTNQLIFLSLNLLSNQTALCVISQTCLFVVEQAKEVFFYFQLIKSNYHKRLLHFIVFFCICMDFHLVAVNMVIYTNRFFKKVELNLPSWNKS